MLRTHACARAYFLAFLSKARVIGRVECESKDTAAPSIILFLLSLCVLSVLLSSLIFVLSLSLFFVLFLVEVSSSLCCSFSVFSVSVLSLSLLSFSLEDESGTSTMSMNFNDRYCCCCCVAQGGASAQRRAEERDREQKASTSFLSCPVWAVCTIPNTVHTYSLLFFALRASNGSWLLLARFSFKPLLIPSCDNRVSSMIVAGRDRTFRESVIVCEGTTTGVVG